MNEVLEAKEIKDLIDDYNKCDYYINKLNNGNINCLSDAIDYSDKKYQELYTKDILIAEANTNHFPTNLDSVSQTIKNLIAIKNMITEIIAKKISNK